MTRKAFPLSGQFFASLMIFFVALSTASAATADKGVKELHRFFGGDGENPTSTLIADAAGNLYGTTELGGGDGFYGTVFELSPPSVSGGAWTETTLYIFGNHGDGARPRAGLIFDAAGNLYGTTSDSNAGGFGEIFQLSPPAVTGGLWTETVLYSFGGVADGAYPQGSLVSDPSGNLYGASETSVFELSPPTQPGAPWAFTLLHKFKCCKDDGWSAQSSLVRDVQGNLYGTTLWGGLDGSPWCGSLGCGTVFMVSPPATPGDAWSETVIHRFWGVTGGKDGINPLAGLALDASGNVYGTTYALGVNGGGIVFQLKRPATAGGKWVENVIHSFSYSNGDGAAPLASPIFDASGNLLGTTLFGGKACFFNSTAYGCGIVYELKPPATGSGPWTENILYRFNRSQNSPKQPEAGLLLDNDGNLFGTSTYGGYQVCQPGQGNGCGTVYEVIR